jgi:lysophospholipase L1-like esterase
MSEHLAKIDASCYVLDCLWNMGHTKEQPRKGRNVDQNYEKFIRSLRAKRPKVPIIMAEQCDVFMKEPNAKDRYIKTLYKKLLSEGWTNLYYLSKDKMYSNSVEGTVDGCHPNDLGMASLAVAFGDAVRKALAL